VIIPKKGLLEIKKVLEQGPSYPYQPGTQYHIRIDLDVRIHQYSVWVRSELSSIYTGIAHSYAFRSEQAGASDLSSVGFEADSAAGGLSVCNVSAVADATTADGCVIGTAGEGSDRPAASTGTSRPNGRSWLAGPIWSRSRNDRLAAPRGLAPWSNSATSCRRCGTTVSRMNTARDQRSHAYGRAPIASSALLDCFARRLGCELIRSRACRCQVRACDRSSAARSSAASSSAVAWRASRDLARARPRLPVAAR
jgi:hypothetical protein